MKMNTPPPSEGDAEDFIDIEDVEEVSILNIFNTTIILI